jgi:signal transduction histidine kinase
LPPEKAMRRAWQQVIHQEDLPQVQEFWSANVYLNALSFETYYRIKDVDGRYRWNLVCAFPIKDEQNRLVQWFGTCTDIHEQKELELEKQKAREEAELANRTKDEFIAVVSHELRSPLNAIVGWTKLLKNRKFDPVIFSCGLETIERNTQSQVQLIEDLLDISRMVRGNLRLTMSSVNLATIVETTVNSQRFLAEAKQQELRVEIKSDSCRILGDINRLQQIVNNLISNAIKFTPSGGRVEICLEQVNGEEKQLTKNNYAQIRVTDTGQGIDPDFLPHIFERFSQAVNNTTRGKDGLGLGLAIVHHLVELHGGSVNAFSEGVGLGATFTVVLPILEDEKIRI